MTSRRAALRSSANVSGSHFWIFLLVEQRIGTLEGSGLRWLS